MVKKLLLLSVCFLMLFGAGCEKKEATGTLRFATAGDYPPFEYYAQGTLTGFDVELAQAIAQELEMEAVFDTMPFGAILASVHSGMVDAGISTFSINPARQKNFDFSVPYHVAQLAVVYPKDQPLGPPVTWRTLKIACQVGTTMQAWVSANVPSVEVVPMDTNLQAIEGLKAGHVRGVVVDELQAKAFVQKNPSLAFRVIAPADEGYGVVLPKNSPLTARINGALQRLKNNGTLESLEKKWLAGRTWTN